MVRGVFHVDGVQRAGGLGTKRHEMIVLLERDAVTNKADFISDEKSSTVEYDKSRIPTRRFYEDVGNVSTGLQQSGLVSKEQMNQARAQMAARGGHLCDHLLVCGFIDEDALRTSRSNSVGEPAT
jgi:hypothetical protein